MWNTNEIKSRFLGNSENRREPTDKQKIGKMGENYACDYLRENGYRIIDRNYLKKWGELDIVAKKGNIIHFVEVKSISRSIGELVDMADSNVTHVTPDEYRAEDNMHPWKLQRLGRAVQSYLLDKNIPDDIDWQFDVITVHIDRDKGLHKVFLLSDIVL